MNSKQLLIAALGAAAMITTMPTLADRYRHDDGYSAGEGYRIIVRDKGTRNSDRRFERYLDRRQDRQLRRIEQGIDSGELTRKEAGKLKRQQRRIARMEEAFSADGHYSPKERRALEARLDKASDKIYRKKHNERVQRYAAGLWKPRKGLHEHHHAEGQWEHRLSAGQGFFLWW